MNDFCLYSFATIGAVACALCLLILFYAAMIRHSFVAVAVDLPFRQCLWLSTTDVLIWAAVMQRPSPAIDVPRRYLPVSNAIDTQAENKKRKPNTKVVTFDSDLVVKSGTIPASLGPPDGKRSEVAKK